MEYHLDTELFRSAIQFTSAETGFNERLVEKDYYGSAALEDLCSSDAFGLVFKGGTCLSKVHADFYRLSEDLDFSVSAPIALSRTERSRKLAEFKKHLAALPKRCSCFRTEEPLRGFKLEIPGNGAIDISPGKL